MHVRAHTYTHSQMLDEDNSSNLQHVSASTVNEADSASTASLPAILAAELSLEPSPIPLPSRFALSLPLYPPATHIDTVDNRRVSSPLN